MSFQQRQVESIVGALRNAHHNIETILKKQKELIHECKPGSRKQLLQQTLQKFITWLGLQFIAELMSGIFCEEEVKWIYDK